MGDKQYYDTYAKGIYELYNSFRLAGFEHDDAFELTKICIINQCVNPYAALDRKYRSDRLKASLNNLKSKSYEERKTKND